MVALASLSAASLNAVPNAARRSQDSPHAEVEKTHAEVRKDRLRREGPGCSLSGFEGWNRLLSAAVSAIKLVTQWMPAG